MGVDCHFPSSHSPECENVSNFPSVGVFEPDGVQGKHGETAFRRRRIGIGMGKFVAFSGVAWLGIMLLICNLLPRLRAERGLARRRISSGDDTNDEQMQEACRTFMVDEKLQEQQHTRQRYGKFKSVLLDRWKQESTPAGEEDPIPSTSAGSVSRPSGGKVAFKKKALPMKRLVTRGSARFHPYGPRPHKPPESSAIFPPEPPVTSSLEEKPSTSTGIVSEQVKTPTGDVFPPDEKPSTSAAAIQEPHQPLTQPEFGQKVHAYYRLPSVQPGIPHISFIQRRCFDVRRASKNAVNTLRLMRLLFSKEVLNEEDMLTLARLTEDIVAHGIMHESSPLPTRGAARLSELLSRQLIILDAVLCSLHLFKEEPHSSFLWTSLLKALPPFDTPSLESSVSAHGATYGEFLWQLGSMLSIYKQGIRPTMNDVIEVKRNIFCKIAPHNFGRSHWDEWRRDDGVGEIRGRTI